MTEVLLRVENLHVSVGDTPIIQGISLELNRGEIHAIMGRNGAGKSTLANVIMGHPAYQITSGTIHYKGKNIEDMEVFERARAGMFLSFQYLQRFLAFRLELSFVSPLHRFEARPLRQGRFVKNSTKP